MAILDLAQFPTYTRRLLGGASGGGATGFTQWTARDSDLFAQVCDTTSSTHTPAAVSVPEPLSAASAGWKNTNGLLVLNGFSLTVAGGRVTLTELGVVDKLIRCYAGGTSRAVSGNRDVGFYIGKNGSVIAGTEQRGYPAPSRQASHVVETYLTMSTGDYVEIFYDCTTMQGIIWEELRLLLV